MSSAEQPQVPPVPQPPAVYLHHLFVNPQDDNRRREQMFFFRLFAAALTMLIMMASFFYILWYIFHPQYPHIQLASATLSPLTTTNTTVTGTCNFTLLITNANRRIAIYYHHFDLSFIYPSHHVILSQTTAPSLWQTKNERSYFLIVFNMTRVNVGNDVVHAIKKDLRKGSMEFEIKMHSMISLRQKGWSKNRLMKVHCKAFSFGHFPGNEALLFLDPYAECDVHA